jgi:HPt (histidine-containing phosphotransfer) domain-containing protein
MPDPLDRSALDDLLAMTGGDPTLFGELLDTFLSDAEQYLGELEAAASSGDPAAAFVRPAHSLKSNAMSVGATRLAELCRGLEADAKAGMVGSGAERVAEVREELEVVRPAIAAARAEVVAHE